MASENENEKRETVESIEPIVAASKMLEGGNAAAMHEALVAIRDALADRERNGLTDTRDILERRIVDAALSAPPRNCDVGTAREQVARFENFCAFNTNHMFECKRSCPCKDEKHSASFHNCFARWAQMPYEEGDSNA